MSDRSYLAKLVAGKLQWEGEAPPAALTGEGTRVRVQILQPEVDAAERGLRMKAALERLAAVNAFKEIDDPVAWQREIRKDRPLPGRGE